MLTRCSRYVFAFLRYLKKYPHVFILLLYFVLHLYIFRGIVEQIPQMLQGTSVLARDELIPFFDAKTQFVDQMLGGISPLTQSSEVRISYSFITAWVRYYKVLPFAIVVLPSISAFLLYLAFYLASKQILQPLRNGVLIYGSFLSATFIHLILLQSKITHFYTLLFGFSLFAISVTLLLEFFIKGISFSYKKLFLLTAIVLLNPGIHYHFLFIFLSVLCFVYFLFINRLDRGYLLAVMYRFVILLSASTIPYVLLIWYITTHSGNLTNAIPLGYLTILYSSVDLPHLFSFDIASPYDMFTSGMYLVAEPRYLKVGFLSLIMLNAGAIRSWNRERLVSFGAFVCIFLIGIWFSLGYLYPWSAHNFLGGLAQAFRGLPVLGSVIQKLVISFFQVLRYPHRFEFLYFYASGVLVVLGIYAGAERFKEWFGWYLCLVGLIVIIPFCVLSGYSTALWSGNFGGFLTPYTLSSDFKEIKQILKEKPGLSIIMPTLESGRMIEDVRLNFVDKFLIYYFNTSFLYYGTAASAENRFKVFEAYESMLEGTRWWDKYLRDVLSIDYILAPKVIGRLQGKVYLPQVDEYIKKQLSTSTIYEVVYQGSQYDLFRRRDYVEGGQNITRDVYFNISHTEFGKMIAQSALASAEVYLPLDVSAFVNSTSTQKFVYTDRPESTYFDLLSYVKPELKRYTPDSTLAPFDSTLALSADYASTPLSLASLLYKRNDNKNLVIRDLVQLNKPDFLVTFKKPIEFKGVKVVKGLNDILIKGVSMDNQVFANVNGVVLLLTRLESTSTKEEFVYFKGEYVSDRDQKIKISVQNGYPEKALALESLLAVPRMYYPTLNSNGTIGSVLFNFTPMVTSKVFRYSVLCGDGVTCLK